MLSIRDAGLDDADGIARLHALSWRRTYRGIMPDRYLDGPLEEERRGYWRRMLSDRSKGLVVLLGEADGALVGFVAGMPDPDGGPDALIDNLHIDPAAKGRGHGRLLIGAAAERLHAAGCRGLFLWVYDGNSAAIEFYRRLGAEITETGLDTVDGEAVPHRRLAWADAATLGRHE